MIAVIAFALFAFIIGDLFSSGFNTTSKDVVSMEKIFHLKILESKWAMLKSGQGITSTAAANRVWDQEVSVALLNLNLTS
jgi:peptidyl-prolyl cis-trans isomerase D